MSPGREIADQPSGNARDGRRDPCPPPQRSHRERNGQKIKDKNRQFEPKEKIERSDHQDEKYHGTGPTATFRWVSRGKNFPQELVARVQRGRSYSHGPVVGANDPAAKPIYVTPTLFSLVSHFSLE